MFKSHCGRSQTKGSQEVHRHRSGQQSNGKLNFYVSAVAELMKGECDNPTIGLLICKYKDGMTVEWSFRGMDRPLCVSEYENELRKIKEMLPSADDIKANLEAEEED